MNIRWLLAAFAAVALVVVSIPTILEMSPERLGAPAGEAGAGLELDAGTVCSTPKPANLDFTLKDMHGREVNLAEFRGQVILLDFWATWCGPCKVEIPWFVEFQERYRDQGFTVLGFSVDDPVERLRPFAEEFNMNYPVLVGRGREDVQEAFGPIWGIPTTVLIDRDGAICQRHMGLVPKDRVEAEIQALL